MHSGFSVKTSGRDRISSCLLANSNVDKHEAAGVFLLHKFKRLGKLVLLWYNFLRCLLWRHSFEAWVTIENLTTRASQYSRFLAYVSCSSHFWNLLIQVSLLQRVKIQNQGKPFGGSSIWNLILLLLPNDRFFFSLKFCQMTWFYSN